MSWTNGPFLGFDTETTGVDPAEDRIVTAAIVHRSAREQQTRTWIIDPGVDIPESASKIHGITTQQAREEGARPTEALEEIATLIVEAQLEGVPLVAFNASFDLTILDFELTRHGIATLEQRLGRPVGPVIDPLVLDRALNRFRKGSRKLGDLVTAYGVTEQTDLHTADVDVEATLDVLAAIIESNPHLGKRDLNWLHSWQASSHRQWALGYNKWRRRQGLEGPGAEVDWPLREAVKVA